MILQRKETHLLLLDGDNAEVKMINHYVHVKIKGFENFIFICHHIAGHEEFDHFGVTEKTTGLRIPCDVGFTQGAAVRQAEYFLLEVGITPDKMEEAVASSIEKYKHILPK